MVLIALCSAPMGFHEEFPEVRYFCKLRPNHAGHHEPRYNERDYLKAKVAHLEREIAKHQVVVTAATVWRNTQWDSIQNVHVENVLIAAVDALEDES